MAYYLGTAKNPNAFNLEMLETVTHKLCGRAIVLGIAILPQGKIKTVLYNTFTAPSHPKVRKSFQDSKSVNFEAKFFNNSQTSVV